MNWVNEKTINGITYTLLLDPVEKQFYLKVGDKITKTTLDKWKKL